MVQRLVIPGREEADSEFPVTRPWWQFSVRFNVAVSQSVPIVRMHERESEGVMVRWGLVGTTPTGALSPTSRSSVRSDGLKSAEDLRRIWISGQRGIVPLAGFYLWQRTRAGHDQPFYVRLVNRPVFGAAALWDRAESGDEVVESCVLVTVAANPLLAEICAPTGQMPAILRPEDYHTWLAASVSEAQELLQPFPHNRMVCHPVAPYVNHPEFDGPRLIRPADR